MDELLLLTQPSGDFHIIRIYGFGITPFEYCVAVMFSLRTFRCSPHAGAAFRVMGGDILIGHYSTPSRCLMAAHFSHPLKLNAYCNGTVSMIRYVTVHLESLSDVISE